MKLVTRGMDTLKGGIGVDDLMNMADMMASSAATLNRSQQNYDSFVESREELKKTLKQIFEA